MGCSPFSQSRGHSSTYLALMIDQAFHLQVDSLITEVSYSEGLAYDGRKSTIIVTVIKGSKDMVSTGGFYY